MHLYLSIILACLTFMDVESKIYEKILSLQTFRKESGWYFLDRMSVHSGTLQIDMQIKIKAKDFRIGSQFKLQLLAVPSQFWPVQLQKRCDFTKYSTKQLEQKTKNQLVEQILLNAQGDFEFKSIVKKQILNQTYFNFILRDCTESILKSSLGIGATVNIKLNIITNGEYRSSTETIYSWLLPLTILLCLGTIFYLRANGQEEEENWIKYILKISLWVAFSATVFKYFGHIIYAYLTGQDYQFFDFMYLFLYSISDSIIIVLLMLLAFGWTVTFKNTKDFDLYIPLASMLGVINIIMTTLNKVTDGNHNKFHVFDSIPAYIMVFFRLIGFGVFVAGIITSFIKLKERVQDQKKHQYFVHLAILGTFYLTFIPGSLLLINLVQSHYRKQVMFFLVEIGKYGLSIWLGYLSGHKKSIYRNIVDGSFMEKGDKYF